jgi:hypothetical protein
MCSVPSSPIDFLLPGLGLGGNKTPSPPQLPPLPQGAKMPDTAPLAKRNNGGGPAIPAGSTLLTGPSGISNSSLIIGASSLLGGGKPGG